MRTSKLLCTVACLAFLAAGVSCNKEAPGAAGEMPEHFGQDDRLCTATFRLNLGGMKTKAVTTGSLDEDAIRRIDVFPDFGEDSPNLSFDAQAAKKRQQGPVLGG